MSTCRFRWVGVAWILVVIAAPPQMAIGAQASLESRALVDQYCVGCHNDTAMTGGLSLEERDLANVSADADTWERVVRKLRAGMMPPPGAPRPEPDAYDGLIVWLESELDRGPAPHLVPPGLHRLNRTEYANAVRDLLALRINPATLLPSDDSSYGFDNMAGTLGISPTLVEAYVSAAQKISRLAMGSDTEPLQVLYRAPEDTSQDYHIEGLPFGTRGGMRIEHEFPADGDYVITVLPLAGDNMSPGPFGSVDDEQLEVLVDGGLVLETDFPGRSSTEGPEVRITTTAGPHVVGATFLERNFPPLLDIDRQFERDTIQTGPTPGYTFFPHVGSVRIDGPFNATRAIDSPSRRRIFVCRPGSADREAETACARRIVTELARRAFRGTATAADIDDMMEFYENGRADGEAGDFDRGIETAVAGILSAVKFIYRIEQEPAGLDDGEVYALGDLELASRLSFFLWSSIPDNALLSVAESGRLTDPEVLEAQVRRMLEDPRAEALARNFAGQWLNLRGMESVGPLAMLYPDFDHPLREAMRREVELLFDSVVREDRNVLELLTADYTFVDERLASHYGIPGVYGSQFRRVALGHAHDAYRGLLGKGAILTTTSKPERTSPVTRGKWIMTNILGVGPPNPPPDVPPLPPREDDGSGSAAEPTMREQMAAHQVRADCVQCHRLMDPIGFALENFDGIARWRDEESQRPVDAASIVYDGTAIDGPADLRRWLLGYSDQFVRVVAEKLLTYALGRGVEYPDMPVVRAIADTAAGEGNRFSALVIGVTRSDPFRMNVKMNNSEE